MPTNSAVYKLRHRVIYGDTDAGGVVYNANFLRYFEKGRTELMRDWVCSYREIEALGLILPVTECFARYKSPAFYDDLLEIETSIAELRRFSCRFNYKITRKDEHRSKPTLIVKGYTIHAAVTREGKLTRLPENIMSKLQAIFTRSEIPPQNLKLD
jgi:acyl-CoA thioester hydrolase